MLLKARACSRATMVLSSRAVDGWAEEWAGGGRCARYGRIGGQRDGHKGGVKGPLLMKQKKKGKFAS